MFVLPPIVEEDPTRHEIMHAFSFGDTKQQMVLERGNQE